MSRSKKSLASFLLSIAILVAGIIYLSPKVVRFVPQHQDAILFLTFISSAAGLFAVLDRIFWGKDTSDDSSSDLSDGTTNLPHGPKGLSTSDLDTPEKQAAYLQNKPEWHESSVYAYGPVMKAVRFTRKYFPDFLRNELVLYVIGAISGLWFSVGILETIMYIFGTSILPDPFTTIVQISPLELLYESYGSPAVLIVLMLPALILLSVGEYFSVKTATTCPHCGETFALAKEVRYYRDEGKDRIDHTDEEGKTTGYHHDINGKVVLNCLEDGCKRKVVRPDDWKTGRRTDVVTEILTTITKKVFYTRSRK